MTLTSKSATGSLQFMDIREKSSPALTGEGEKELFLKYTGAVCSLSQGLRSGQAALPGPNLPDGEGGIPSTATLVHGREGKHLTPAPSSLPRKGNAQLRTPPAAPPHLLRGGNHRGGSRSRDAGYQRLRPAGGLACLPSTRTELLRC